MIAAVIGLGFVVVGLIGLLQWFPDFITLLKGIGPISLILGGCVAFMAGINSFQKNRSNDKSK